MSTVRKPAGSGAVLTVGIALGAVVMVAPFVWLVIATTHTTADIFATPPNLLPGSAFWDNLRGLFVEQGFGAAIRNSVVVSTTSTVLGVLICSMAGYAFAKFSFRGRTVIFGAILASMTLPSQVTLVPLFQTMVTLGWLNTYPALILPNLAVPFGIFLMRQSMLSVPDELIQAARIDGAGELRVFFRIVLPVMKPALSALAIFLFLGQWNDFVYPLTVLRTKDAYTIPVALASLQGISSTDYGQLLTGTFLSVVPVLALFLFLQRQFVAGLLAGSVKQ
ncbi:carbohydrate ABC transporter permease [Actinoplanes sp. RD1]|uniref:carbohydrate ABC transporter permease n=1 Tax=Actinoplanes sp. RD1 TaxID=3064538 RepID=UPI0027404E12|nr:carbohydrate ABC transporter permease [Actinoplanes sp. RD1]